MTEPPPSVTAVQDILFREARLLDAQRWDEWLEMYCEDAVFWVPAPAISRFILWTLTCSSLIMHHLLLMVIERQTRSAM